MLKGFGKGLFPSRTKKKASEPEGSEAVIPVVPIGMSASGRDCLSMLCLEHGRHRIEELPHMVCGVRRMKQPVRHETVPIGRDGFEHGVDVGP